MRLVLSTLFLSSLVMAGCSDKEDSAPTDTGVADTGADTAKPDTRPADTTPPVDTGPITCQTPLPGDFACTAPKKPVGGTACTDVSVDKFIENCFNAGGDCAKWQKDYAACNTCVFKWLTPGSFLNIAACMAAIKPGDTCATSQNCLQDCRELVCEVCSSDEGTGRTASKSERDDCLSDIQFRGSATRAKGLCYDNAKKKLDDASCNTTFEKCLDLGTFFRGACRDNGDFTNADKPKDVPDAGPTDTGPSDTGAGDTGTAPTDTGTATDTATTG